MRLLVLALFMALGGNAGADVVSLLVEGSTTYVVPSGQFITLKNVSSHNGFSIHWRRPGDTSSAEFFSVSAASSSSPAYYTNLDMKLAGPCTLDMAVQYSGKVTVTFEIGPQAFDAGQTVIVQAGTAATLYLEESFDLKGWTNTFTTNYTAGVTNRFFRIRAVRQ